MSINLLLINLGAVIIFMHLWFVYAAITKRNDIADVAWGLGFILLATIGVCVNFNLKTLLVWLLVSFWGFRLAWHIFNRFIRKKQEDKRYLNWRQDWGKNWLFWSWAKVFLTQGFFLFLVALPIIFLSQQTTNDLTLVNLIGLLLWIFGISFETIADKQLKTFLSKPKQAGQGRIMKTGLWKFSRHPNYFGEAVIWWGMWLITFGDYFWLTIIGPITITLLLRFVSGVPLAEAGFKDDKEFQEYAKKTPAMFPNLFIK